MENPSYDLSKTIFHLKTQLTKYINANRRLEALLGDATQSLLKAEQDKTLLNDQLERIQSRIGSEENTQKEIERLIETRDRLHAKLRELQISLSTSHQRIVELSHMTQEYENKNLAFDKALREIDRKFCRSLAIIEHQREILAARDKVNKRRNQDIDQLKEKLNYALKQRDVLIAKLRDASSSVLPIARET